MSRPVAVEVAVVEDAVLEEAALVAEDAALVLIATDDELVKVELELDAEVEALDVDAANTAASTAMLTAELVGTTEGADVDATAAGALEISPPTITYLPEAMPASTSAAEINTPLSS